MFLVEIPEDSADSFYEDTIYVTLDLKYKLFSRHQLFVKLQKSETY